MKTRNAEAARLEADYLSRVRAALGGREESEIEEIVESLRAHIEEDLSTQPVQQIGLVQMANVLEKLGSPEAYSRQDGSGSPARISTSEAGPRRLSKLALGSLLCIPLAAVAAKVVGLLAGAAVIVVGFVLGLSALREIRSNPTRVSGRGFAWAGVLALPAALVCLILAVLVMTPVAAASSSSTVTTTPSAPGR